MMMMGSKEPNNVDNPKIEGICLSINFLMDEFYFEINIMIICIIYE
jgi:hypothetical protein